MPASCLADPPLLRDLMILFGREVVFTGSSVWLFSEGGRSGSSRGGGTLRCLLAQVDGFLR